MKKPTSTEQTTKVSRRKLIQGIAAVTAAATTGLTLSTLASARDKSKQSGPPPDKPSYRALALFLLFTTPPQFFATMSDQDIATKLGLVTGDVTKFRNKAVTTPWQTVRNDINTLLSNNVTSVYTGPQCPLTFDTLAYIASLSN
jgi:hypothetical protein